MHYNMRFPDEKLQNILRRGLDPPRSLPFKYANLKMWLYAYKCSPAAWIPATLCKNTESLKAIRTADISRQIVIDLILHDRNIKHVDQSLVRPVALWHTQPNVLKLSTRFCWFLFAKIVELIPYSFISITAVREMHHLENLFLSSA